ncbi:MAG: nuclear transport factor 2 family protein [Pseudomonadota bacterium]
MKRALFPASAALVANLFFFGPALAQSSDAEMQAVLNEFQEAWSTQDTDAVLAFFADDFTFEDVPLSLKATNKEELRGILDYTFASVPNFNMDIFDFYEGNGFVATKWVQSGNATVKDLNLTNHPYEVTTTSIITFDDDGLITSVFDNWNVGILFQ